MTKKTLDEFKNEVVKELGIEYLFSYCPVCYCLPIILNSHNCKNGWENWYQDGKGSVLACAKFMKKHKVDPVLMTVQEDFR